MTDANFFVGFQEQVRVISDSGLVYLDDGQKMYRMSFSAYGNLLEACTKSSASVVLEKYPRLFETMESAHAAATSIDRAHGQLPVRGDAN